MADTYQSTVDLDDNGEQTKGAAGGVDDSAPPSENEGSIKLCEPLANAKPQVPGKESETPGNPEWAHNVKAADLNSGVAYEWLKDVTSRLTVLEGNSRGDTKEVESNHGIEHELIKTRPHIRDCNWEQFKNRYSVEDCTFAIEVLLSGEDLDSEMEDEQLRRLPSDMRKNFESTNLPKANNQAKANKKPDPHRLERVRINSAVIIALLAKVTGETAWAKKPLTFLRPFKILIHFHDKIKEEFQKLEERFNEESNLKVHLAEDHGHLTQTTTEIPAGDLISNSVQQNPIEPGDPQNQSCFNEDPGNMNISQPTYSNLKDEPLEKRGKDGIGSLEKAEAPKPGVLTEAEFEEIKCYMEFVTTRLLPSYHKFDHLDHSHRAKVKYADLWSLFRTGELLFQREDSRTDALRSDPESRRSLSGRHKGPRLWRLHSIGSEELDWEVHNLDDGLGSLRRTAMGQPKAIELCAYYIDFDGLSYSAVNRDFEISVFDGEKEITELEVYPARFRKDASDIIKTLQKRGNRFRQLLLQSHLAVEHDGWTLTHDPTGNVLSDSRGVKIQAEYIDSDVIIDFNEAFQVCPQWKPSFMSYVKDDFEPATRYDKFAIITWSDNHRTTVLQKVTETVISFDDIESLEWNALADEDNFATDPTMRTAEANDAKQKFGDEDLALLPSRLLVYSLRHRKFINADVGSLKPITIVPDPFKDLKISDDYKRLIKATVRDHFEKKRIQKDLETNGNESIDQDFIRGKGKGLVILLHGAPGVGKTATAEAVAYSHEKPLFPITCGDLGIEPTAVEGTLSEIFRLANLWDCVLLLDEAEIFLSRRERKDDNLQRNALVSIFLRTLEYYPGILFLTTNRVGVLDEAINSRVHITLYFGNLRLNQTVALFDMNIQRSEKIAEQRAARTGEPKLKINEREIREFAMENYENRANEGGPWWNGRQIRNAFQIATSLAYADSPVGADDSSKNMGREHFEQIQKAIQDYEKYRENLFHKTDSELAEQREERRVTDYTPTRRNNRRFDSGPDYSRFRPNPRPYASYPSASSSTRETPERMQEPRYPPSANTSERPSNQPYPGQLRASVERSPPRGGYDDYRDPDDYNYAGQRRL